MARDVILSKSKNTFSVFLFLENRKEDVKPNMFSEF